MNHYLFTSSRDRVVHHALCEACEPLFERGFIPDSYANRKGKGTHRAVARYERFRDRYRHVLRCDNGSGTMPTRIRGCASPSAPATRQRLQGSRRR